MTEKDKRKSCIFFSACVYFFHTHFYSFEHIRLWYDFNKQMIRHQEIPKEAIKELLHKDKTPEQHSLCKYHQCHHLMDNHIDLLLFLI